MLIENLAKLVKIRELVIVVSGIRLVWRKKIRRLLKYRGLNLGKLALRILYIYLCGMRLRMYTMTRLCPGSSNKIETY